MAYRALDLTLISAQELKNVNIITKLHAYATASLSDDPRTQQRTPTDRLGGKNPTWKHTSRFFIPADDAAAGRLSIHVLIQSKRMFGDRNIGECRIPLKDLISSEGTQTSTNRTYLIRKGDSRKLRGVLNISYKLAKQEATPPVSQPHPPVTSTYQPSTPGYASPYQASADQFGYSPSFYGYGYYPQSSPASSGGSMYGASPASRYLPSTYGYGYYPQQSTVQQSTQTQYGNNFGTGLGAGLIGGALGGLLVDDMISSDATAYDVGYDAGFDNGGGLDD